MLTGDLKAIREDQIDLSQFPPAPALTGVPDRLFVAAIPESRLSRLGRLISSVTVSTLVHALLVVAFVLLWQAMVIDLTSSEPISVEVVNSIPGETAKTPASPAPKSAPKRDPLLDALPPLPESGLAAPPDSNATPDPAAKDPTAKDSPPSAGSAPDQKKPALVEPPPEPQRAATQTEKNDKANTSDAHPKDPEPPPPVKPLDTPKILTAPQSDTSVPPRSSEPDPPKPAKPAETDQRSTADPTAQMAAALPMNTMGLPSTFRSMLSAAGTSESQAYKGVVFGMIGRLQGVATAARQHGMNQGFVILSITIADSGAIDSVSVLQSSGKAAVDAAIVDLIRHQAPLAPPPPGAQRTFTPSIAFGAE